MYQAHIQANDLAHKEVLRDLIPLAAMHKLPKQDEMESFEIR